MLPYSHKCNIHCKFNISVQLKIQVMKKKGTFLKYTYMLVSKPGIIPGSPDWVHIKGVIYWNYSCHSRLGGVIDWIYF